MSPAASKESNAEVNSSDEDEIRDKTRGEIEVLILVSGLILTPLFYFWQTGMANIQSIAVPIWQNYLQTQLGHPPPFSFNEMMTMYFSPFALLGILPVDVIFWVFDITVILSIIALVIFGFALMEIESGDVRRVRAIVQKGRTYLNTVLLLLIAFAVFHLLNNTMFPFKLLFRPLQTWILFGIALLTGFVVSRLLNTYMKRTVDIPSGQKKARASQAESVDA